MGAIAIRATARVEDSLYQWIVALVEEAIGIGLSGWWGMAGVGCILAIAGATREVVDLITVQNSLRPDRQVEAGGSSTVRRCRVGRPKG